MKAFTKTIATGPALAAGFPLALELEKLLTHSVKPTLKSHTLYGIHTEYKASANRSTDIEITFRLSPYAAEHVLDGIAQSVKPLMAQYPGFSYLVARIRSQQEVVIEGSIDGVDFENPLKLAIASNRRLLANIEKSFRSFRVVSFPAVCY